MQVAFSLDCCDREVMAYVATTGAKNLATPCIATSRTSPELSVADRSAAPFDPMAFARFTRDSDVYVYADTRGGFTCERCPGVGAEFRRATAAEMLTHLLYEHRAKGQRVPDEATEELWKEAGTNGLILEVIFSGDRTCKAEITWRRDGLFQIWLFREVPREGEYEPEVYWSPFGREAILADSLERAKALAEDEIGSCVRS
ncbi:hypothetical protein [Labilithrix luteola]|nr:hypothetical protein [Labilithrix luteola]